MPKKEKGYTHQKADRRQNQKRIEAEDRQIKYDSLTIAEKFATLIEGGSKKQRSKLTKQLETAAAKGIPKEQPAKKASKKVKSQ